MTSSSLAPSQIGKSYPRQNFLVQSLQSSLRYFLPLGVRPKLRSENLAARLRSDPDDGVDSESDSAGSSGMMVLFEKQVHLQKDGGPVG